jgi:ABC-type amino acid transport substrate-binding protein
MKFKYGLLVIIFTALLFIAAPPDSLRAGAETPAASPQPAASVEYMDLIKEDYSFLNAKTVTAVFDRWSEQTLKEITNITYNCFIDKLKYSNSLTGCLAMLKSGRADLMMTTDLSSIYAAQRNSDMKAYICKQDFGAVMMLRASDVALRDLFNSAIKKLQDSGRLGELRQKWIKEFPAGGEPEINSIEKINGAETIFVGVSGDMPPLDYVSADGRPAGFNAALLGDISKELGKNIEIVTLDSQARFAALESKKIDVFFWIVMPIIESVGEIKNDNQNSDELAFHKKYIVTIPYCKVKNAFLIMKY